MRKYIGARYMPKFVGTYDATQAYEALSVVDNGMGTSYVSNKPVPPNTPLTDTEYWTFYGAVSGAIINLQNQIDDMNDGDVTGSLQNQINNMNDGTVTGSLQNQINTLISEYKNIITVGASGAMFTTINAAITYARDFCSESNRVLLVIYPGVYDECINLHPNPGIDMIGYGAKIRNTTEPYPETALYTNHTGTFIGIYFENSVAGNTSNYAVHIERDLPVDHTGGVIKFIDCEFVCHGYHGIGVGMSSASELYLINCRAYTGSTEANSAALYLHNAAVAGAQPQVVHLWNSQFKGTYHDFRIDDALTFWGGSGTSQLYIDAMNCSGNSNKGIFCLVQNVWDNSYIHDTSNIILEITSHNNAFLALNKETETGVLIATTAAVTPYNQVYIPSPLGKPTGLWQLKEFKLTNDGLNYETHATADATDSWNYGFIVGVAYASNNVQTITTVVPA